MGQRSKREIKRGKGFYWVKIKNCAIFDWTVGYWDACEWHIVEGDMLFYDDDPSLEEVNENRIVKNG